MLSRCSFDGTNPDRTIIRDWSLHVPWDDCVEWLVQEKNEITVGTHSRETAHTSIEYARDTVINHRMECICRVATFVRAYYWPRGNCVLPKHIAMEKSSRFASASSISGIASRPSLSDCR